MDESWVNIAHARIMVDKDNYGEAFDSYLVAFEENPDLIPNYEKEFCSVLLMLTNILVQSNRMDSIFHNFARALRILPNNTHLLNDIGKYLYKFGFYKEAWEYFEKVLKINPTVVDAQKNINSINNLLVERWHFRMLNDNLRNEAYRQAIRKTVVPQEDSVLDVGTGTGLLSIYAHEAGASKVIGCDGSEVMCNLADNIVHRNRIKKIKIINKMSSDLTVWDLGVKCSVLVTEMFDAGLFGEHVLQMLSHAWPALLSKQAKVIPNSAEFFVAAVQCDHLSISYKLCSEAKSLINIPSFNVHVYLDDESYDCEDVHLIKDIKYLTEPKSVLKINLNDIKDIKENLMKTEPCNVQLIAKDEGVINLIIGWFNLHLTDSITITTNPCAPDRANAWQQAIFFDNIPRTVQVNDLINLEFLVNGGKLTMAPTLDSEITRVTSEVIRFLNDLEYMRLIISSVDIACVYLKQVKELSEICIADLCPFPLFGLQMLKRGAKSLLCCATNKSDYQFFVKVFLENNIPLHKVSILFGDEWTTDVFEENYKYHLIFTHSLELCGDVNLRLHNIAQHLRSVRLAQGGLVMPAQVKLVAQLVSSRWLDLNNRLYDENVSNYKMATHVNKYKVTQNFAIDFSTLKYVPISEPIVLCNYPDATLHEEKSVKIISDGYANAILCWYNIELMDHMQEISTNRPNSFISGMLFLTYPQEQLIAGNFAKIIQQKDTDGYFELVMEPV